jgi:P27 family predicted phage terminase small subunit
VAGPRQPIQLLIANGKKNLTKAEIAERLSREIAPCADDIKAPSNLSAAEKKRFDKIAHQLDKLGILGETDVETLARYVVAQGQYEKITKELRTVLKKSPDAKSETYFDELDVWIDKQEKLAKLQNRFFTQAQTAASALGLTISSRCKLIAPKTEEAPKENKFAKFGGGSMRA